MSDTCLIRGAERFILDPEDETSYEHAGAAPMWGGIYALWSAGDVLLYIGLSDCISRRLLAHWRSRRFRHGRIIPWLYATLMPVPEMMRKAVEVAHIHALTPPYNRLYEPKQWGGHDAHVEAIRARWRVIHREQDQEQSCPA